MIPPDISINGRSYSLEDIRTGIFERHLSSDFERDLLLFIKAWLLGQPAFRISTSGTTGEPKFISVEREKMVLSAHLTRQAFGLQPGDVALLCLSPKTIAGIMMAVRCLSIGMPMICTEPAGNPLRSLPPGFAPRFAAMVPLQLETILNEGYEALLREVRALLLGGAPVNTGLERRVEELPFPVYHTFGMTETLTHVAYRPLNGPDRSEVFSALPGYRIRNDRRGCLEISGSITDDEWVTTNDMAEILDEAHFRWLGRWDHIINSGGIKVNPEELERRVLPCLRSLNLPPVYIAAGLPDDRLGEKICLVFESNRSVRIPEHLWIEMGKYLPRQQVPREVYVVNSFFRTENGKIRRREVIRGITEGNFLLRKSLR